MNREVAPTSIAPPAAAYAHAIVSEGTTTMLHTAGVVPIAPDGTVPEGLADQAKVVWGNITAILAESGFSITDIVSMTTFVVAGANLALVMGARDEVLQGHRAASTLVYVPALARPQWLMEVAVVAAR
ncbi:MAG TPA: RidA family protein [Acidimicrobiales bacterium]|nr:RidA family protein [Acidimicrobiales bacterium]